MLYSSVLNRRESPKISIGLSMRGIGCIFHGQGVHTPVIYVESERPIRLQSQYQFGLDRFDTVLF